MSPSDTDNRAPEAAREVLVEGMSCGHCVASVRDEVAGVAGVQSVDIDLHVHPSGDHPAADDDSVGFAATFPTAGRYRLFLQFKHDGRIHTVAFTQEVR